MGAGMMVGGLPKHHVLTDPVLDIAVTTAAYKLPVHAYFRQQLLLKCSICWVH